jgi:hypothetical protein
MSTIAERTNAAQVNTEARDLFARVVNSEGFRSSQVTRSLLLYLWEHQGERISEYALAVEALGRSADFDPKTDATVRVQIARLRTKLKEFYEAEGDSFPLQLRIPLGTHDLQWSWVPPDSFPVSALKRLNSRSPKLLLGIAIAGALCTATLAGILIFEHTRLGTRPSGVSSSSKFWTSFTAAHKPTAVVVFNAMGFTWSVPGLTVFNPYVRTFPEWSGLPGLKEFGQKWGPPSLNEGFTVAKHAMAGVRLIQYLDKMGQEVHMIESEDLPADGLAVQNTVLLGSPTGGGALLSRYLDKTNFFAVSTYPGVVGSRRPKSGEVSEYHEELLSQSRRICPGIITVLPKRPEGTRTVLLVGRWTGALTMLLTSPEGLKLLDETVRHAGSPDAWEMVVQAEVQSETTVLKVWPVAIRALPANFWE